jgi:hypothetical protein
VINQTSRAYRVAQVGRWRAQHNTHYSSGVALEIRVYVSTAFMAESIACTTENNLMYVIVVGAAGRRAIRCGGCSPASLLLLLPTP